MQGTRRVVPFRTASYKASVSIGRISKKKKKPAAPIRYYWVTGFYIHWIDLGRFEGYTRGCAISLLKGQPLTYSILDESMRSREGVPTDASAQGLFAAEISANDFDRLSKFDSYELESDNPMNHKAFVLPIK